MRRQRRVKIAATLGPASDNRKIIKDLFLAGADVFRLNLSHGTHSDIKRRFDIIRDIEAELDRPICIMADLQGPKLRCGHFKGGSTILAEGDDFCFDLDNTPGDSSRVCLPHIEIFEALDVGSKLLIDDGKIRLKVLSCEANQAKLRVLVGGVISDNKGVNVPDVVLPVAALSEKDRTDLEFVCRLGVDWLALSFVQRAKDIEEARKLVKGRAEILSKIEKPAAVEAFDSILEVSDGIMVARGDLGVELPVEAVPPIQKRLVSACRAKGKPVIVATQMMESMINAPVPTRAEVSDVAQAIYEGADVVMLSAESAAGLYPVEAVSTMNNVAVEVEKDPIHRQVLESARTPGKRGVSDAITVAAREIAETTNVKAICCFTHSGTTALLACRERPRVPIIALTPKIGIARRLTLNWGLHCVVTEEVERFKMAVVSAARAARENGFASNKDKIVVIAGVPFNVPGSTNILRVAPVNEKSIFDGEID
ncbi:MAG: pyruvate kinase [Paracoccaceae bacterium]|nr:pyruvate kinase [Paracoccaceae bacterium]